MFTPHPKVLLRAGGSTSTPPGPLIQQPPRASTMALRKLFRWKRGTWKWPERRVGNTGLFSFFPNCPTPTEGGGWLPTINLTGGEKEKGGHRPEQS